MKKLTKGHARRILSKVKPRYAFWLCTNDYLLSLKEVSRKLDCVGDEVFRYHVNRDKNDFERWIRDTVRDRELAREISRIKTRRTLTRKINERIEQLHKLMRREKPLQRRAGKRRRWK